jgi:hypothetical protein
MVSGHRRRLLDLSIHVSAAACVGAIALACGNIGLSADNFTKGPDGAASITHDAEASDGGTAPPPAGNSDGGVSVPSSSNPLCNVAIQNAQGRPCNPDVTAQPSGQWCQVPDSGVLDASASQDGGIVLACHVIERNNTRTQTCSIGGSGGDGDSCQTGDDCAPTFECVGMPGRCRHYCCDGDKSCSSSAAASFCDIQTTAQSNLNVPVCSPVSGCNLLTPNACLAGETCAIVKDDGTTSCVAIGAAAAGQGCDSVNCSEGLTCIGKPGARLCYTLCRLEYPEDCATGKKCKGSAALFVDPQFGICE